MEATLVSCKERYPFKGDLVYYPGKWIFMEKGIKCLRELADVEVMCDINLSNNILIRTIHDIGCMQPMWRRVLWSAPSSYVSIMAGVMWKGNKRPMVDEVANIWQHEEKSLPPYRPVTTVEKTYQEFQKFKDNMYNTPTAWIGISDIRNKHSSAQDRI